MEEVTWALSLILIILFLAGVYWYQKSCYDVNDDCKHEKRCDNKPPTIYMRRDDYLCTERSNGENAICSGDGFDEYGNRWKIIDVAEYQERSCDDVRRYINMRISNECETYVLEGLGHGERSTAPGARSNSSWSFVVVNHPGLRVLLKPVVKGDFDGYVFTFDRV